MEEYQTRTEYGRITQWTSLKDAIAYYDKLESHRVPNGDFVYKISFGDAHRFRPKRRPVYAGGPQSWSSLSEARIAELCPSYRQRQAGPEGNYREASTFGKVFWVDQSLKNDFLNFDEEWLLYMKLPEEVQLALQIKRVLTNEEFRGMVGKTPQEMEEILRGTEATALRDQISSLFSSESTRAHTKLIVEMKKLGIVLSN